MQSTLSRFGVLFFALLLSASVVQAQYLVSSKAGFVNRVEGKVNLKSQDSAIEAMSGKAAMGTQMKEGDRLATDANSYAELLLAPGSYLRMNEKTEIEAVRTTFDSTRFDVVSGAVILEVGEIDKKLPVEVGTPRAVVTINKAGIYRIDVVGKDVTISVRKGEAFVGTREQLFTGNAIKIGNNKAYSLIGDTAPQTTKLNAKVFDAFDQWSYLQAESLVAANNQMLQRSRSRNALLSGWIYDPYSNRYTYIPSSWLFVNPYGFGFYRRYTDCAWCWGGYYPYNYGGYYGGTTTAGGGGGVQPSAPARVTNDDRGSSRVVTHRNVQGREVQPYSQPEVFTPVDRSSRYGGSSNSGGYDSGSVFSPRGVSSPGSSSPSYSPPPAPSRVDVSPAPSSSGGGGRGDTSRGVGGRGN